MTMTPEELHQRVMLHELRTILLDEGREGDQLPEDWKAALRENPHETTPYLVLADWLDEQGSDIAELCRIQCELIDKLPLDQYENIRSKSYLRNHPFFNDFTFFHQKEDKKAPSHRNTLLAERSAIAHTLYPKGKRGRTTRMLTDLLRYCHQTQRKQDIVVLHPSPYKARLQLMALADEILGTTGPEMMVENPPDGSFAPSAKLWGASVWLYRHPVRDNGLGMFEKAFIDHDRFSTADVIQRREQLGGITALRAFIQTLSATTLPTNPSQENLDRI